MEEGGGGGRRGSRVLRNSLVGRSEHSGDEGDGKIGSSPERVDSARIRADLEDEPKVVQPAETSRENRQQGLGITVLDRSEFLLAGGTEDWEDLSGGDVDRLVMPLLLSFPCFFVCNFCRKSSGSLPGKIGEMFQLIFLFCFFLKFASRSLTRGPGPSRDLWN
jgi:hypothetical protein